MLHRCNLFDSVFDMVDMRKINQYLTRSGWSESYLSKMATGNARAIANVRSGKASIATYNAIIAYIRDNPVRNGKKK